MRLVSGDDWDMCFHLNRPSVDDWDEIDIFLFLNLFFIFFIPPSSETLDLNVYLWLLWLLPDLLQKSPTLL
jgi:hypothetical protein